MARSECTSDSCPYAGQIEELASWRRAHEEARMEDYREVLDKMGEVHEKVNSIATRVENIAGWKAGAVFAIGGAFTIITILVQVGMKAIGK